MLIQELFDLHGKVALVTGSNRGIGLILARGLGQAGATVVLNGRDLDKTDRSVATLNAEGLKAFGCVFDVREEDQIVRQLEIIEKKVGGIDILVNNAGVQIRLPLEQFAEKDWRDIIDVHLTGTFLVTRNVVRGMMRRRCGKIINICSIQSELARPGIAPYAAAKGGLKMLTLAMATEWGKHNIQANGIAPGYFKTEMTRLLYEDEAFNTWLLARTPANRWGNPAELVGAAIFLASKASDYVNGHILFVDGGLRACV